MHVTSKIKMDLTKPDPSLVVNAVQGEAYTRFLQIALYTGINPWTIPEDIHIVIRYAKPDRTMGCYDTLPDGSSAWSAQGNSLSILLAPQMLTVPGNIETQIQLIQGAHILSTFSLTVFVEADPTIGLVRSENYLNWLQWIEDQAQDQVELTQQAANTACQASQAAALEAENASNFAANAASFADSARSASVQAQNAATSAIAAQKEAKGIASEVSSIVAGNEAYTKLESDHLFSTAIIQKATGETIAVTDSLAQELQGLKLFGKTTQNGTPTPAAPLPLVSAGSNGAVTASILGRNLFYIPPGKQMTMRGLTQTAQPNGSILINGTKTESGEANIYHDGISAVPYAGRTITLRIEKVRIQINVVLNDGRKKYLNVSNGIKSVVIPENAKTLGWQVSVDGINSYDNVAVYPYAVFGTEAGPWEPYIEPQTVTCSTPSGLLRGIPVTSGGNYTDENGQQWVCDEVDFARGVHIQRVFHIPLDANIFEFWPNHGVRTVNNRSTITFNKMHSIAGANNTGQYGSVMMSNFTDIIGSASIGECVMWENGTNGNMQCSIAFNTEYVPEATESSFIEFFTANPGEILIGMHNPIETALSKEELAAYAALHTHFPNTTILNNGGAGMEVSFAADTKLYVDNKFAALAAALVSSI